MDSYNDYFNFTLDEYWKQDSNLEQVYREHLETASKDKLIDIALEGHDKYQWANDLAYERGLEIETLNQTVHNLNLACLISIISCVSIVGVFYIYQFIKFRLRKYAEKIRKQTINELSFQNKEYL